MRALAAVFSALLLTMHTMPAAAAEPEASSLEEVAVELATTPAQHAAVASYYRSRAADARVQAERHRRMAKAYDIGKMKDKMVMASHCDKLRTQYEELAKQYDELAAVHDAEAQQ